MDDLVQRLNSSLTKVSSQFKDIGSREQYVCRFCYYLLSDWIHSNKVHHLEFSTVAINLTSLVISLVCRMRISLSCHLNVFPVCLLYQFLLSHSVVISCTAPAFPDSFNHPISDGPLTAPINNLIATTEHLTGFLQRIAISPMPSGLAYADGII